MTSVHGKKARVRHFFKLVRDNKDNYALIKKELNKLIQEDLDLNVQSYNGYTLLHLVVRLDDTKLIKLFYEAGVNIEVASINSETPLLYAIIKNKFNSLEALVELGADLNAAASYETNALHLCVNYNRITMLDYLLEKGINVDMPDEFNKTAILQAFNNENIEAIKVILKYKPDVFVSDNDENSVERIVTTRKNKVLTKLYNDYIGGKI